MGEAEIIYDAEARELMIKSFGLWLDAQPHDIEIEPAVAAFAAEALAVVALHMGRVLTLEERLSVYRLLNDHLDAMKIVSLN